jgi:hypothetical protein
LARRAPHLFVLAMSLRGQPAGRIHYSDFYFFTQ